MPVLTRRAARTAVRTVLLPLAATGLLAVTAPPAAAHTELVSSSPSGDATLDLLPEHVTLTFSDTMTQKYAKIAVTASDDSSVAAGEPRVAGKEVTLALKPGSTGGRYTVGYRVVSADGHPVAGSYTFTVESVTAPSPSASAAPPVDTSASPAVVSPGPGEASGSSSGVGVPVLAGAGVLVVTGAGAYLVFRKRSGHGG
ncbi:copper resistance protein CopC [Streptomyces scopuliridis]|uniref:copper resistance CopC family protein n=1 Tax=Streptomyces scopuliridis TaxID=452529 RepID=UPI00369876DF